MSVEVLKVVFLCGTVLNAISNCQGSQELIVESNATVFIKGFSTLDSILLE